MGRFALYRNYLGNVDKIWDVDVEHTGEIVRVMVLGEQQGSSHSASVPCSHKGRAHRNQPVAPGNQHLDKAQLRLSNQPSLKTDIIRP